MTKAAEPGDIYCFTSISGGKSYWLILDETDKHYKTTPAFMIWSYLDGEEAGDRYSNIRLQAHGWTKVPVDS